jgi:hypothetical protein
MVKRKRLNVRHTYYAIVVKSEVMDACYVYFVYVLPLITFEET